MSQRFFSREVIGVAVVASLLVAVSIMPPWNPLTAADEPDPAKVRREADDAFASEHWKDAADRYKRLMELDDAAADGALWFRLGYALHAQGKLNEAIRAHQQAAGYSRFAPTAKYNLACALALQGKKDHALETLTTAVEIGFYSQMPIERDPDFASIKDDPRFKTLAKKARPPVDLGIYRKFDFWVGRWRVVGPGGKEVGISEVVKREKGFALVENWKSESGGTGVSLNFFDPGSKKWKQTWVDASGNVIHYVGGWQGGKMSFEGRMATITGQWTLSRMSIEPLTDGRVHQRIVRSFDDGKSWNVYFDGHYEPIDAGSNTPSIKTPVSAGGEPKATAADSASKDAVAEANDGRQINRRN